MVLLVLEEFEWFGIGFAFAGHCLQWCNILVHMLMINVDDIHISYDYVDGSVYFIHQSLIFRANERL
jgi:hypothetical protein